VEDQEYAVSLANPPENVDIFDNTT
jgi:hypothetical protein